MIYAAGSCAISNNYSDDNLLNVGSCHWLCSVIAFLLLWLLHDYYTITMLLLWIAVLASMRCLAAITWQLAKCLVAWVAVKRPGWSFCSMSGCEVSIADYFAQWLAAKRAQFLVKYIWNSLLFIITMWIYYVNTICMSSEHVEISGKPSLRE